MASEDPTYPPPLPTQWVFSMHTIHLEHLLKMHFVLRNCSYLVGLCVLLAVENQTHSGLRLKR